MLINGTKNQNRYLLYCGVIERPQKLPGTELVMGVTDLYQWSLDMNAFNDTSKSIQI